MLNYTFCVLCVILKCFLHITFFSNQVHTGSLTFVIKQYAHSLRSPYHFHQLITVSSLINFFSVRSRAFHITVINVLHNCDFTTEGNQSQTSMNT